MSTTVIDCVSCGQKLRIPTDRGPIVVSCPPCGASWHCDLVEAANSEEQATDPIPVGAHLLSPRAGFCHHGIHLGAGRVMHCPHEGESSVIQEVSLDEFREGHGCGIREHEHPSFAPEEVIARARSMAGRSLDPADGGEMFCEWCINDLEWTPALVALPADASAIVTNLGVADIARSVTAMGMAGLGVIAGAAAAALARDPDAIPVGAHLVTRRPGYFHHGIYVGEGRVVHYSGWARFSLTELPRGGKVEEVTLADFAAGRAWTVKRHKQPAYGANDVVERARSRLGEDGYSVVANNCEHFCEWCINGDHHSGQVDVATGGAGASAATIAGLAARGVVAASGSVVGLSGAGIMSGLATAGSVVGGGAVAGIGVLAGAPAIAAASLLNSTVLADGETLDGDERDSRSVGRMASYAGAAAGTAGSIVAVSVAGTAGLSAAGITSGLAAIGGIVGGGMAGGVVIATAAPVAAAAGLGYGAYKLVKWIKD